MTSQQQASTPQLVPLNTPAPLGPWIITVTQAIVGEKANAMLLEKNAENPTAPDGLSYVLARVTAQNTSSVPRVINLADFAATGADGILRRPPAVNVPDPALQVIVPAGESLDGIVPVLVDSADSASLWFDSAVLGGNWTSAVFALGGAAAIPNFPIEDTSPSDAGSSPENAVQLGEPVRTGGWEITIQRMAGGQELFDLADSVGDYRANALGAGFIPGWAGLLATATNLSQWPAVFPNDAFLTTDSNGEPWDNVLALTPPEPDISREMLPGVSREGWAAFDFSEYENGGYPTISYVRIQPNAISDEPRYVFIAEGDAAASESSSPEGGTSAESDPLDVAVGDTVTTIEDLVNLRSEASTSGEPLTELPLGTELEITGDPIVADGYRWYPVEVIETGETGFIVQDFIEPA